MPLSILRRQMGRTVHNSIDFVDKKKMDSRHQSLDFGRELIRPGTQLGELRGVRVGQSLSITGSGIQQSLEVGTDLRNAETAADDLVVTSSLDGGPIQRRNVPGRALSVATLSTFPNSYVVPVRDHKYRIKHH